MDTNVFANINSQTNLLSNAVNKNIQKPVVNSPVVTSPVQEEEKELSKAEKIKKIAAKTAPVVIPLAAVPISAFIAYKCCSKNVDKLNNEIKELSSKIAAQQAAQEAAQQAAQAAQEAAQQATQQATQAGANNITGIKNALYGLIGAAVGIEGTKIADKLKTEAGEKELYEEIENEIAAQTDNFEYQVHRINENERAVNAPVNKLKGLSKNAVLEKYMGDYYGVQLLYNKDENNRDDKKLAQVINDIPNIASKYLANAPEVKTITKENPTVWSVTSELEPIKEGGLGKVPLELAKNSQKTGVNMPTFIPMYQKPGVYSFNKEGDKISYSYKGNKYDLKKVASYNVDSFKNGKPSTENVEIYSAMSKGNKILFIKNDNYFNGSIYETNHNSEEAEKFAFFSKCVYEFAKIKAVDDDIKVKSENLATIKEKNTQIKAENAAIKERNEKIKAENKEIENRNNNIQDENMKEPLKAYEEYKALIKENPLPEIPVKSLEIFDREEYNSISTPDAMILNDWQAAPYAALARYKAPLEWAYNQISDDVKNKLSDMNIVTIGHNATYQGSTQNDNNEDQRHQATTNILNTLFDNYSFDIVTRSKSGALKTNPYDEGLKNIDNVLVLNETNPENNHTNLLNMGVCLSNYYCPVSENYANELTGDKEAQKQLSNSLQWAIHQRKNNGSLIGIINGNDFETNNIKNSGIMERINGDTNVNMETYDRNTPSNELVNIRLDNKTNFYNDYIAKKHDLPKLSKEELAQTPVISTVGRMVDQKGFDLYVEAIKNIFENWDSHFAGKNKPLFYIGGKGNVSGQIENIIKSLNPDDAKRVLYNNGFACQPAYAAGADFFSVPSRFEPCGLTQGESLALGTPVIASKVGGLVDTLNRDGKHNAFLTDDNFTELYLDGAEEHKGDKEKAVKNLEKTIISALNTFYNDKNEYERMVKDSIDEDFSWCQKGKKGPAYDYYRLLGIDESVLKDV